jgi:hypothetical protein
MNRRAATISISLWSLGIAGLSPSCVLAQERGDWQFAATLYGWFPDIGGEATLPSGDGRPIGVDISTILDHLKMTFQGSFEFRKGDWGGFGDLVYLDVGETKSQTRGLEIGGQPLPASVDAAVEFDLKSVIYTFGASYRGPDSPGAEVEWIAGARLASFRQEFDWEFTGNFGAITPPPLTGSRASSVDQLDGFIGAKGRLAYGADHNWIVPFYFDVGAGESDLTWQAMLGFGYAFQWGEVSANWRYLDYDVKDSGLITDMNFNGPAVGATFRW